MGQIKNIKLHIVTDIKVLNNNNNKNKKQQQQQKQQRRQYVDQGEDTDGQRDRDRH